jgi:hypothetical protein
MGVSADQEAAWPELARAAIVAVKNGNAPAAFVWFRTDQGVSGVIPVSDNDPIVFSDEENPSQFLGIVTDIGPEAAPVT